MTQENKAVTETVTTPQQEKFMTRASIRLNTFFTNNYNVILSMLYALIASLIVVTCYSAFLERKPVNVGVVDLKSLMSELTTSTFKQMVNRTPEEQKMIAQKDILDGGKSIQEAMHAVAKKYNVVLVQSQALASPQNVIDYTQAVRDEIKTHAAN